MQVWETTAAIKNNKYYIFWVCVCTLSYPAHMHCFIPSYGACTALPHFYVLSHKWHDFWKKVIEHKMLALIFSQLLSETFLILRRTQRDTIIMHTGLLVMYPLFLSDSNGAWIFYTDFSKSTQYEISWKSVQWEPSCSLQTDE